MTDLITHKKVSTKSDGVDTTLVLPSDWNDGHVDSNGNPITIGTSPGDLVKLDNTGKLPTVDGSKLTNLFPINSIFITAVNTNPNTLLGYGTWILVSSGALLIGGS